MPKMYCEVCHKECDTHEEDVGPEPGIAGGLANMKWHVVVEVSDCCSADTIPFIPEEEEDGANELQMQTQAKGFVG